MRRKDYYSTLGVGRNATQDEVKKAYRRLAIKFHPDKNPDDASAEERFREVKDAYEILGNTEKRSSYDRFGFVAGHSGAGAPGAGAGPQSFQDVFGDIFSDILGAPSGVGAKKSERGPDLRYHLEISLEEASSGTEKPVQVPRQIPCTACGGLGADGPSGLQSCRPCGGTGRIKVQQGLLSLNRVCTQCQGSGRVIKTPCKTCAGEGRVKTRVSLNVKVPPGVDNGTRLKLQGEGDSGRNGGPNGDLTVVIAVREHPRFQRKENDIECEVLISFPQAALGTEIETPTLRGTVKIRVPAGTPSGKVFRLKGRGMPHLQGRGCGDQNVKVLVHVPIHLTPRQRELLEEYALAGGNHVGGERPTSGKTGEDPS